MRKDLSRVFKNNVSLSELSLVSIEILLQCSPKQSTFSAKCELKFMYYSRTPLIRTLVIRNLNHPDRLGP